MSLNFEIAGAQLIGARETQEDAYLVTPLSPEGDALVTVADGMGGHAAGNVASELAVQALNRHVSDHYAREAVAELLRNAVDRANHAIAKTVNEQATLKGMGCTVVAVVVSASGLQWASVGDSLLYLIRGNEIRKLNADHSYGALLDRLAAMGQPIAPEPGCPRHMLLSALTGDDILEVDCPAEPIQVRPGDRLLIASDGLNTLNHDQITAICPAARSARDCADRLLTAITHARAKHQDNVTVVVIDVRAALSLSPAVTAARVPETAPASTQRTMTLPDMNIAMEQAPEPVARPPAVSRAASRPQVARRPWKTIAAVAVLATTGLMTVLTLRSAAPPSQGPVRAGSDLRSSGASAPAAPAQPIDKSSATPGLSSEAPPTLKGGASLAPEPDARSFRDTLSGGHPAPEMIWIPAGSFEMGSSRFGSDPDERPKHRVTLHRFAIGKFEITESEYAPFAAANNGRKTRAGRRGVSQSHPVVGVSWEDAVAYTRWLSQKTGFKYRLPSEAEWEYAAGGRATTPFWWGFKVHGGEAHCLGCGSGFPLREAAAIGQFKANTFGLFDTAGNVMEWVQDCYHPSYDGAPSGGSAWEQEGCQKHIARGGAFSTPSGSLRTSKRYRFDLGRGYDDVGFRVLREP